MRNFEASPWLESPTLVEIKAVTVGKDASLNEFNLNVNISRPKEEAAPGAKAGARPPPRLPRPRPDDHDARRLED